VGGVVNFWEYRKMGIILIVFGIAVLMSLPFFWFSVRMACAVIGILCIALLVIGCLLCGYSLFVHRLPFGLGITIGLATLFGTMVWDKCT